MTIDTLREMRCPVHKKLLFKMGAESVGQGHCKDCRRSYTFDTRYVKNANSPHVK